MNEYDSNRILDLTKKINYALTTNIGPGNFLAAFIASSVVNATYPEGVGM